jgi:hypothetical protein
MPQTQASFLLKIIGDYSKFHQEFSGSQTSQENLLIYFEVFAENPHQSTAY